MPRIGDTTTKDQHQASTSQWASQTLYLWNQACINYRATPQTDHQDKTALLSTCMLNGLTAVL